MKLTWILVMGAANLAVGGVFAQALGPATYKDDFSKPINYLTNGVAGTIWDGVYFGAGEFASETDLGMAAGTVSVADASISTNGVLTVASLQTDWEGKSDDGFFLFKIVTGDFDMSVRVAGPVDTRAHNFPGLMVRAFGPSGAPAPGGQENYFIWGRFNEYNIPNMLKNNVNGVKRDTSRGIWPNTNYWLRIQRANNVFNLFEKAAAADDWSQVGSVTRNDFADRPLEVGIEHADYDGGRMIKAGYGDFSLTTTNLLLTLAGPAPAANLKAAGSGDSRTLTWAPGNGSGTLVTVWSGSPVLKEAPADGMSYHGNSEYGMGDALPSTNCFVVFAGPGKTAAVSRLRPGTYHAAAFAYAGSGTTIVYTHTTAIADFVVEH